MHEVVTNHTHSPVAKVFSFISLLLLFSLPSVLHLYSGLYEIFQALTKYGIPNDTKGTANEISKALVLPLQYLFLVFPGWLSAMGVLIFSRYNSKRFYRFWVISAVMLIPNFPFGVLFGIVLAITLFVKRKRFQHP